MAEKRSKLKEKKTSKKLANTETRKKDEIQKEEFSVSKKISDSVVTGKTSGLKKTTDKGSLKVDVYDIKGKVIGEIELPKEIFGEKVNKTLLTQATRVYLANQRKGTASTKTRGEVRGSTRKIYKQKGTGRARHGAIRAPIFVHGGIVFGPKPRDYSLQFPKKMKRKALFSALSAKVLNKEMKIIDGIEDIEPKTKVMLQVLKALNTKEKNLMIVLPSFQGKNESVYRAARNIKGVRVKCVNLLNAYEVLKSKMMLFPKSSIEEVKKTFIERQ